MVHALNVVPMRPLTFLAALGLLASGCETTDAAAKKKTADASEYEYVTPLGSNIPVRVKKGTTAASTTSPTATMTGEQAADMASRSGSSTPDRGR